MNESGDIPTLTRSSTPDNSSCSIISIIPNLGMSSCRGRAEAFARSLSTKLRTLGSQSDDDCATPEEDVPIVNRCGETTPENSNALENNTSSIHDNWGCCETECENTVTQLEPLRCDNDLFFDFDCELESPGSPVDECEYLRLIETASTTPHNSVSESGYVYASTASSKSSTDGPYYGVNEMHAEENSLKEEAHKFNGTLTNEPEEQLERFAAKPTITTTISTQDSKHYIQQQQSDKKEQQLEQEIKSYEQEADANLFNGHATSMLQATKEQQTMQKDILPANNYSKNTSNNSTETISLSLSLAKTTLTTTTTIIIPTLISATKVEEEKFKSSILSGLDTTDDEDECRPQPVRRCSSLKSGKTPPGTPGRKKIVRFADKLGLDLADIKTFLDEIPNIPKSAYEDLEINDTEPLIQLAPKSNKVLVPLFQQPGGLPKFLDLVRERQVSLENAAVTDHINQTITGSVRVRNLDFHKSVHVRYTLDHWHSFADLQANYVENSCDGFCDKFSFIIFGNSMQIGQRLELAVRFQCKGQQFWDNNYGINYCFQCLPANNNISTTVATTISQAAATTTIISNNNQHNNNNHHNNSLFRRIGTVNTANIPHKPLTGSELEQNPNNLLRFLSPFVGDAWCNSFY